MARQSREFGYFPLDTEPLPYLGPFGEQGWIEALVNEFVDRFGLENRQRKQRTGGERVGLDLLPVSLADAVKTEGRAGRGGVEQEVGEFVEEDF